MPEENKYTTTGEEVGESMADAECISSGSTGAESPANAEASSDAIGDNSSAYAPSENVSEDTSPLDNVFVDGDQLAALAVPGAFQKYYAECIAALEK